MFVERVLAAFCSYELAAARWEMMACPLGPISRRSLQVWPKESDPAADMPPYANPRDIDVFKTERDFSIWRPKVGLNDCLSQTGSLRHQTLQTVTRLSTSFS
eukprot:scaffold278904_cov19-Prasinocladus_malaysianus.AAC.2